MNNHDHLPRVLLVEDDKRLAQFTSTYLSQCGFQVTTASNGDVALERVLKEQPDLVLLDIMLPGIDGFTVCRRLRQEGFRNPVLLLSARSALADELTGFEAGADDYLRKPIQPEALLARVQASLQRTRRNGHVVKSTYPESLETGDLEEQLGRTSGHSAAKDRSDVLRCGRLSMNKGQRRATLQGKRVELTCAQFDLLWLLAQHRGQALSRQQISSVMYGKEYNTEKRVIDIHISKLRKRLGTVSKSPEIIKSIHGVGYMMVRKP